MAQYLTGVLIPSSQYIKLGTAMRFCHPNMEAIEKIHMGPVSQKVKQSVMEEDTCLHLCNRCQQGCAYVYP